MATLIRMPAVMTGAGEAVIATWVAAEGATVAVGDVLAEVETEKAVVELAAETAGVLVRRLAAEGDTVQVGAPVAVLGDAGEDVDVDALLGAAASLASEAQGSADDGAAVGGAAELAGAAEEAGAEPAPAAAPAVAAEEGGAAEPKGDLEPAAGGTATSQAEAGAAGQRLFASPLARKMAREADVDLARLHGTGPGGRIVRRDVEAAIAAGPAPAPAAPAPAAA
ncbi:dihydrolipoamide acyltransferase, partial [Actinotalea ferrariae CF5-4]